MPLLLSLSVEHSHGKLEIHLEQNKYTNSPLFASGQKEIEELLKKDIFKVVIPNKVVIPEEIPSSTKGFNSCFSNDIKDSCINKTREKSHPIIYIYNDERKISC